MSIKNALQNIVFQLYVMVGVYAFAIAVLGGLSVHNRIDTAALQQHSDILFIATGTSGLLIAEKIAQLTQTDAMVVFVASKIMDKTLKSGEYSIFPHMKGIDILNAIDSYTVKQRKITITNGTWYGDMDTIIETTPHISDKTPIPRHKVIWAETYFYERDSTAKHLIARMQELHLAVAETLWQQRDKTLPLKNLSEALVLASMVERETGIAAEQPIVAGVFINRLCKNMYLQSDPTVIYAVTNGSGLLNRPISKADLKYDSPYNTYTRKGLPPSPIASVGLQTVQSVLHPATHDYYYFVASPNGGHVFAQTLDAHNKNVSVYRNHLKQSQP